MRAKKAVYNSITSLIYEIVLVITGLILPRLVLTRFGSQYNGVISSIGQFISYASLLTSGVGVVTQAALYKPLAERDTLKLSGIIRATELFMRKVALIFAGGLLVLAVLYPFIVKDEFDWFFVFTLVLILGFGTFMQYFFGITYRTLLAADQRAYISTIVGIAATAVSTLASVVLLRSGYEIRVVKLASALTLAAGPAVLYFYARKRYNIIRGCEPDNLAIKQRWDAFLHQIAHFVHANTDIVLITLFIGVREVSVYTVHCVVLANLSVIVSSLSGSFVAPLGDMMAKNEYENTKKTMALYEFIVFSLCALLYTCAAVLISPFVAVYTRGVQDVDYYRPVFAYLVCVTETLTILQSMYWVPAYVSGRFRETRKWAVLQAVMNLALSLALVTRLGITGVIIGTLCSVLFRLIHSVHYTFKHIIGENPWNAFKKIVLLLCNAAIIVALTSLLPRMSDLTILAWVLHALGVFGVAAGVTAIFALLFYRKELRMLFEKFSYLLKAR